jgi:hypothetical protein
MKKLVQIHEFDPVLYPRKLWVCFKVTREVLEERFSFVGNIEDNWFNDNGATTSMVNDKETNLGGLLVWTSSPKLSVNHMAHEASHVANFIFDYIGEDNNKGECYAYLVGWAAECIDKASKYK